MLGLSAGFYTRHPKTIFTSLKPVIADNVACDMHTCPDPLDVYSIEGKAYVFLSLPNENKIFPIHITQILGEKPTEGKPVALTQTMLAYLERNIYRPNDELQLKPLELNTLVSNIQLSIAAGSLNPENKEDWDKATTAFLCQEGSSSKR
jgi:hypothetical protein